MQRYFVEQLNHEIIGSDAHHVLHVMRMKTGDEVIVCANKHCLLVNLQIRDGRVYYEILKELEQTKSPHVTLIQGLPKHPKTETITKYATLFGVSHIVFVPMKRSIAKLDNEDHKLKRLYAIAKEASELAHRFDIPDIHFEQKVNQIAYQEFDILLLADENEEKITLEEALPSVQSDMKIGLIIGPEGGIADEERLLYQSMNARTVSLGKNILPTELASLYALTYISLKNH